MGTFGADDNICTACASGCTKCNGTGLNNCQACGEYLGIDYYLLNVTSNTCDTNCTAKYYPDNSTHICVRCVGCLTCENATKCLSCDNSSSLVLDTKTYRCVYQCPDGQYPDYNITAECQPCPTGCDLCKGPSLLNCSKCTAGSDFYQYQGKCLTECPDGYWANSDN